MLPIDMFTSLLNIEIALFDVDMTLIDVRERYYKSLEDISVSPSTPFYKLPPYKKGMFWNVFLSEKYLHTDKPIKECIDKLKKRYDEGKGIILITGRPERLRKATISQLQLFDIPYHHLIMRPEGNREPDYELKPKLIGELISLGLQIIEYHEDDWRTIKVINKKFPWIRTCLHKYMGFETRFSPPEEPDQRT